MLSKADKGFDKECLVHSSRIVGLVLLVSELRFQTSP
jgi:hypothetical protein